MQKLKTHRRVVARQRTVLHSAERIQRPQQPRRTDTQRTRSYESEMVYWTEKAPAASDGQEAEPRAEEELWNGQENNQNWAPTKVTVQIVRIFHAFNLWLSIYGYAVRKLVDSTCRQDNSPSSKSSVNCSCSWKSRMICTCSLKKRSEGVKQSLYYYM